MSVSYAYSVSSDFSSGIEQEKLQNEISFETGITKTFQGLLIFEDNISIYFAESLTNEEKTLLDSIVANHPQNPDPIGGTGEGYDIEYKYFNTININKTFESSAYELVTYIPFDCFKYTIKDILIVACSRTHAGDYSIKVINDINSELISQKNNISSNDAVQYTSMYPLSNLSSSSNSVLTVTAKNNSGNKLYIYSILIRYIDA